MSLGGSGEAPVPVSAAPAAATSQGSGEPPGVPVAVRAQLLATEHWSLLATRSMTWSEVMSRISIHLTVVSASLVVLALVAQVSKLGSAFTVLSIGLASAVLVLGTLTGVRVVTASMDDHALVLGMNRIRAAYLELDPGLERYLVTSANDDMAGVMRTYTLGWGRSMPGHVLGGTNMFMNAVNAIVAGTLAALVASAAGAATWLVAVLGSVAGLVFLAVTVLVARRAFDRPAIPARFPGGGAS